MNWRKSSYSGVENACVELAWRKSSRSGSENNCVEVSAQGMIRDSKNPHGARLKVHDLSGFLAGLRLVGPVGGDHDAGARACHVD
jgi:hypothetical protein